MAWIAFDLDDTLVNKTPEGDLPVEGAPEALMQLAQEGHRLTVYTARFNAMPDDRKMQMKEELEQTLQMLGFPPAEVWVGTHKPACDMFIGANHVTFDQDWDLALAQLQVMMEERGLVPGPQPGAVEQQMEDEPVEAPPEEPQDG